MNMKTKGKTLILTGLILILSILFFFQKRLIDDFSLKEERFEISLHENNKILSNILSEEGYITERYNMEYEYTENELGNQTCIISILKPLDSEEVFFKEKFIDYLKFRIPEINEEMIDIRDYSQANTVLMEWYRGTMFFIAFLLFILIVIIFIRRIKSAYKFIKKELEMCYLREILTLRISEILEESIKLVLLIFGGIFMLQWIIKFQFNIPGRYLPVSDIFDFKFYRGLSSSTKVYTSNYGHFYDLTLDRVRLITLGFFIISIITLLFLIRNTNNKVLKGRDTYGKGSV